jgi:cytochrome P450
VKPSASEDGDAGSADWWSILTDPEFLKNPYPHLRRLRDRGPVQLDRASGVYFILGHRAFSQIAKSTKLGRDTRQWTDGWTASGYKESDPIGYQLFESFQPQMINVDGDCHKRMRQVYDPAFRSQAMNSVVALIEKQAQRLLALMPDEGDIDFIETFAAPLPLCVLCELFNLPPGWVSKSHNGAPHSSGSVMC